MEGTARGAAILPFVARRRPAAREDARGQVEVVRRGIDAYNRRDLDALRDVLHPRVVVDWTASRWLGAGVYRGRSAVMRFYADYFSTFEQIVVEPERFIANGRSILVPNISRFRGRDGIEVVARSTLVFTLRGVRATRIRLSQTADDGPLSA
jgi:ketosteroid isomerase-like protein